MPLKRSTRSDCQYGNAFTHRWVVPPRKGHTVPAKRQGHPRHCLGRAGAGGAEPPTTHLLIIRWLPAGAPRGQHPGGRGGGGSAPHYPISFPRQSQREPPLPLHGLSDAQGGRPRSTLAPPAAGFRCPLASDADHSQQRVSPRRRGPGKNLTTQSHTRPTLRGLGGPSKGGRPTTAF